MTVPKRNAEATQPTSRLCIEAALLSLALVTHPILLAASPTEQEYIKLLLDSAESRGGTAEEAMRHVIEHSDKTDASDQFRLGTALMRVRHHFAAIEVLTRATELAPRNALAFANLGISYYATGNCDKAAPALMKVVELDPAGPRSGDSSRRIGSCLLYRSDFAGAAQHCAKGKELLPNDPAPRLCLGNAQFSQAQYAEALATYIGAHSLTSNAYPPYKGAAQSGVLASLSKLNRLAEAQKILNFPPGPMYTPESIERLAAAAITKLQRGGKPEW